MRSQLVRYLIALALLASLVAVVPAGAKPSDEYFNRIAHFPVYLNSSVENQTVAEIIDVSADGNTLVYSDAALSAIGFIDITDPADPQPGGTIEVDGDPTSVAVADEYVLAAVDTSASFTDPSGHLEVRRFSDGGLVHTIELGGQPDAVKVSPDGRYAAVIIENERDEDLNNGELPQLPAGLLQIVDLAGPPSGWTVRDVDLTGLAEYAPQDPEAEFVDINQGNLAVVTLQENNHVVVVNLNSGSIHSDFSASAPKIAGVDTVEDGLLRFTDTIEVPREPDAVTWLDGNRLATANEGDLFGGSRGFTVFDTNGTVRFDSDNTFDLLAAYNGHYPEDRSENKGSEPEGIANGRYGNTNYLFVGSERGSFLGVYTVAGSQDPRFHQILPTGWGPEGILPIPERDLLVVTSEEDEPPFGLRAVVSIYLLQDADPAYPQITSDTEPWAALSGLAASPQDPDTLYAVWDSFYSESRIFTVDVATTTAKITDSIVITGGAGDYDPEGVVVAPDGTFWVASEGNASGSRPNRLVQTDASGSVLQEVGLPADILDCRVASTNRGTLGSGFEGVTTVPTEDGYLLYVAQQRGWDYTTTECEELDDDPAGTNPAEPGQTRIWLYDPQAETWSHIPYELESVPVNAGWVGLSEIDHLGGAEFLLIERDNLTGAFSGIKAAVKADLSSPVASTDKQLFDLLAPLRASNGWIHDKPEGLTVAGDGQVYLVTDNDGVDDSNGETQFLRLGAIGVLFD